MKRLLAILLCLIIILPLCGCDYKSWYGHRPCDQERSMWRSEDGRVEFFMENGNGTGVLHTEKGNVDIYVGIGPASEIGIYDLSCVQVDRITGFPFETWDGDFKADDRFVATVKETTYFTPGEQIAFYRVDNTGK